MNEKVRCIRCVFPCEVVVDVLLLSRLQFALTILFHYIFPTLTIGLSAVLIYLEAHWLWTNDPIYRNAVKFWAKIYGLNFAMGVATGIVMEFQFGTNWGAYSRYVGDVFGSALAAEGIFAFFLESGFLSVMLFGWDRVSRGFHFFATTMVGLGSIFSSIWITVANSWQQTPAGFRIAERIVDGVVLRRAEIVDYWAMIFNPSTLHRLFHVWIGAFLVGAFFVMSISAWYLLKKRHAEFARRSFNDALLLALLLSSAQMFSGHLNAEMVGKYQPAKLAAFEGHFQTGEGGAPLYLFGWPDEAAEQVRLGAAIPGMLSFLLHGDLHQPVAGLKELRPLYGTPPVWISFQLYHFMISVGVLLLMISFYAMFCRFRGTLYRKTWLLWCFVIAVLPALLANEAGWAAAEVGRQPWVVYPLVTESGGVISGLRTSDALSEVLRSDQVMSSLMMFGILYLLLFSLWFYLLYRKIHQGPELGGAEIETSPREGGVVQAATVVADHRGGLADEPEEGGNDPE